ncbi:MAG: proton-conducting transporter membrane subunit, partial [Gemmatimonadota bacterium]
WELVGACSWALIGFEWRDAGRPRAALDAFLATRAGDLGLYLAAAAVFAGTGTLRFAGLGGLHGTALQVAAGGLLLAAAAKSAQLPFSPWLFRAMAGPTPASALLHSATMVAAGAYALARLAPSLAGASWLAPAIAGLGLATALAGAIVAGTQRDLKKALAASTSAQYGLMFVAIGTGFPSAAGAHLVAHAAFKALLFLGAGIALHAAGTLDVERLGLGRALPRAAACFWIGALALAAVPPLGAAFTKERIVASAEAAGMWMTLGVVVAGALSAFYALRLALLAFGPARAANPTAGHTANRPSAAALAGPVALAGVTLALSVLWLPGANGVVARFFGAPLPAGSGAMAIVSVAAVVLAGATAALLWRRGHLARLGLSERVLRWSDEWLGLLPLARVVIARPTLFAARTLAAVDDRVVDAGIRGAAAVARALSRGTAWWGERGLDGVVRALAVAAVGLASASRIADDRGIDPAVEGMARGIGVAGDRSRRLQTGLAHQYYVLLAAGVLVLAAAAAIWR